MVLDIPIALTDFISEAIDALAILGVAKNLRLSRQGRFRVRWRYLANLGLLGSQDIDHVVSFGNPREVATARTMNVEQKAPWHAARLSQGESGTVSPPMPAGERRLTHANSSKMFRYAGTLLQGTNTQPAHILHLERSCTVMRRVSGAVYL